MTRTSAEATAIFQKNFLPQTLRNAVATPFYKNLWEGIDLETVSLETMTALPCTDKVAIRSAGKLAQVRSGIKCHNVFTSGTSGLPALTARGDRELRHCEAFFADVASRSASRPMSRGVEFLDPFGSSLIRMPTAVYYEFLSVHSKGSFAYAQDYFIHDQGPDDGVSERASILFGTERSIRAFTLSTLERYPTGFPRPLEHVIVGSQLLTSKWREVYERAWGCTVTDYFGLSEFITGAVQSETCGWYFFTPLPELVK